MTKPGSEVRRRACVGDCEGGVALGRSQSRGCERRNSGRQSKARYVKWSPTRVRAGDAQAARVVVGVTAERKKSKVGPPAKYPVMLDGLAELPVCSTSIDGQRVEHRPDSIHTRLWRWMAMNRLPHGLSQPVMCICLCGRRVAPGALRNTLRSHGANGHT